MTLRLFCSLQQNKELQKKTHQTFWTGGFFVLGESFRLSNSDGGDMGVNTLVPVQEALDVDNVAT